MSKITNAPVIILVRPQLGENIGKAARVMLNFGITELRLVAPRDGWPNPDAGPSSSRADIVIDGATVFDDVASAIADLSHVYAATVRNRELPKRVVDPGEAAIEMRAAIAAGQGAGIMFGPEKAGLTNDDLVLADTVWTVPVNPDFTSLNLAQAVAIAAYEWYRTEAPPLADGGEPPATKDELQGLFDHMEAELGPRNYFRPPVRKPTMVRALRNMLQGARFSSQQVRTLRGAVKALTQRPRDKRGPGDG